MADEGDFQPEIKFRWCRTIRCRAQVVHLVLTSITGTQVKLNWKADLGWYESDPTPIPCGFHTGFILVRERVRDFVKNTLETRESDYKVDPFHVVPHKFAVELFLESDEATSFWSEVPELRLRYLSSDHLEKLGTGSFEELSTTDERSKGFPNRKWGSSTCLHTQADRLWRETSSLGYPRTYQEHKYVKGKSHGQLSELTIGELYNQSKGSSSSPNLSRAFQVAVDLSRASSKYLAGVSSTSSGVFLGFEDGSGPPSPENGNCTHTDSAYAAEGETSQESEPGEGARRRKKLQHLARGKSLQIDDLVGDESWRPKRRRGRLGLSSAPSSSFEDLLGSVSADRRAAIKTEINLMRFETIKREKLVKEILQGSDSDFEDEEAPCEASNPDLQGPYQCVITFESRSTSMDDVGSPRALEDVLVSLTSNDSQPETSQPQPLPRTVLQPDLLSDESAFVTSEHEDKIPTPKPRTLTPVNVEDKKDETFCVTEGEKTTGDDSGEKLEKPEPSDEHEIKDEHDAEEQDDPFDIFFGSSGADSSGFEEQRGEDASSVQDKGKELQSHDLTLGLDKEEAASVDQIEESEAVDWEKEDKSVDQEKEIEPSKSEEEEEEGEEEEEESIDQKEEYAIEEAIGRSGDQDEEIYGAGDLLEVSDPLVRISDTEDDNFQYDSLKHDGNENLPIDLRNIDSEESLDIPVPRPGGGGFIKAEDKEEERADSRADDDGESEGGGAYEVGGVYEVEGAEAAYSSADGEVPTDSVTLVPLDSYKGTVREVKSIEMIQEIGPADKDVQETFEIVREKPIVEILKVHVTDVDDETVQEVEYVDNEETDRSETEAVLYVTDVSRKRSVESDSERLIGEEDGVETRRSREQRSLTGRTDDQLKDLYSSEKSKERSKSNNDYDKPGEMDKEHTEPSDTGESFNRFSKNGYHVSDFTRLDNFRDKIHFDDDYRDPRLSDAESRKPRIVAANNNRELRRMFSDSDAKKIDFQTIGINTIVRDDQNSENHRPFIRPLKLLDTGTQTSLIKQISRTTSIDLQKLSDTDSSSEQYSTKYSRTPLRNRTNGQAESYTPLPDRLSGPWSQRHSASTSNARSSASTSPYLKPDLTLLQRNLYNLVQGSETTQVLQNSAHLQRLRGQQNAHIPRYQGTPTNVEHRRTTSRPSTPDLPLSEHSSPKRQYHYHQSSDHNHYHQARSHYSPVHHKPQSAHYSPSYQYKYPLLSSSVITPSSPSRTPYVSSFTSGRINGLYSGSVTDLTRTPQKIKYDYITSTPKSGASGVRPASSLPDLRQPTTASSSLPRQPSRVSPTYEYLSQGPRHAQSASDIMVGGYGSKGKRVSWREWRIADESDSGDSTDSLIDEAERLATTRIDIEAEWDDRYRRRYRSRRRTRSHQEFSTWRDDSEAARRYPSNRPYLPYRGDQLSPGQQVKVLAPGGGVAVARVLTNQRSALLANKSHIYPSHGVISPASVTVILLTEPNRLQGTVVTIPLEKVLLAWPRV
ncbi:uncharacterized protein [Macrobrachium rosenbergii]|uniref:uncharacterized protein n=1 Tax=Macrobrachium rosenbergii TaxID=79674 RepID=UPI0034D43973